ncbi:MAG: HAD family hydrolase [Spirochaetota bacterium]
MTKHIDQLPTAVLFDFGDTLMEIYDRSRRRGIEALLPYAANLNGRASGPAREQLIDELAEFGRGLDYRFETLSARHNIEYRQLDFHRLLYGKFGIEFSIDEDELEWRYWDASLGMRPEEGLAELLEALRRRSVRMAVISNTSFRDFVLRRELQRQGLLQYFEFVMASADYGIRKPDPLLYQVALQRMGLPADQTWYAGNMTTVDCAGAQAAGMRPLWYAAPDIKSGGYAQALADLPAASIVIRHWTDLEQLLPTD